MLFMLVILLITFIALKIKTPSFPEDNPQDLDSMKTGICLGIALFTLTISFLVCYLEYDWSSLALILLTQSFFHGIVKVGFLGYFIYKTPNLYNFVINSFQLTVVNPVNEFLSGNIILSFASFQPTVPNRIDVIPWKINSLTRVVFIF